MLIVLFGIGIVLLIIGAFLEFYEGAGYSVIVVASLILAISIIASIYSIVSLVETKVVDEQIAMYTEENAKIEEQIDTVVKEYMEYEGETFTELKGDSSITLVSLYPDLKSDELVKTQIATYQANNQKIKELKETKINAKVYKWWLYFGK